MVGFLKPVARMTSLVELTLRFPEPSHVVVIRIISFSPKLLPISRLFFWGQRRIEQMRVIWSFYRTTFSEAKEAPYRPQAVLGVQDPVALPVVVVQRLFAAPWRRPYP